MASRQRIAVYYYSVHSIKLHSVVVTISLSSSSQLVNIHRRGNDFSAGGAKIEWLFGWGSKNWWKTIKTIKFKV